uniref:U23-Nephitoxin-Nsp1n_1 n=1 Tax=Nephila sp. SGP-2016 TaxID=1905176 RepID=A0A4Q8KAV8_9ARAC
MMKLVVLLVLIAMTTPAFARSFQEVLQMFTNLGCKETKIWVQPRVFRQDVR